ncbi:hypothetical protein LTR04_006376 [Oleoguttula sp. CCFEE 6159]|nr:hypothetical protein LTR04_006376 [Oleoguttula sp. CCFEE 6159]
MSNYKNTNRCALCGISKDPNEPDFVRVAIGLDEPDEAILCKCKSDIEMLDGITRKQASVLKFVSKIKLVRLSAESWICPSDWTRVRTRSSTSPKWVWASGEMVAEEELD